MQFMAALQLWPWARLILADGRACTHPLAAVPCFSWSCRPAARRRFSTGTRDDLGPATCAAIVSPKAGGGRCGRAADGSRPHRDGDNFRVGPRPLAPHTSAPSAGRWEADHAKIRHSNSFLRHILDSDAHQWRIAGLGFQLNEAGTRRTAPSRARCYD